MDRIKRAISSEPTQEKLVQQSYPFNETFYVTQLFVQFRDFTAKNSGSLRADVRDEMRRDAEDSAKTVRLKHNR
jgi:hypothetical protein